MVGPVYSPLCDSDPQLYQAYLKACESCVVTDGETTRVFVSFGVSGSEVSWSDGEVSEGGGRRVLVFGGGDQTARGGAATVGLRDEPSDVGGEASYGRRTLQGDDGKFHGPRVLEVRGDTSEGVSSFGAALDDKVDGRRVGCAGSSCGLGSACGVGSSTGPNNERNRRWRDARKARKRSRQARATHDAELQASLKETWLARNALERAKAERAMESLKERSDDGWAEQRRIRNELAAEKARKDLAFQKSRDVAAEIQEKQARFDLWAQGRYVAYNRQAERKQKYETVPGWAETVVSGQTGSCAPSAKNSSSNGRLSSLPSLSVGSSISNRERFLERRAMKLEEDFRILEKENERLRIAGKKYKDIVDQDDRLHKLVAQTTY